MSMTNSNYVTGCIDTADGGKDHRLQLWIERNQVGFVYVIRSQYQPGGKLTRRCALDTGATNPDYDAVVSLGRAAFDAMKQPPQA